MTTSLPLRPSAAPEITSWNRLPMHSVPRRRAIWVDLVELDGSWRFELFGTPEEALAATPPASEIAVPGAWTLEAFDDVHVVGDLPHYTNIQMPFAGRPPHPPADRNPTGVYEREIEVPASWSGRRIVLHVGAAESVLLVHLDGAEVGVGKDSHLASEFDVTPYLTPDSTSTLRLVVVKWSDASYIEDQDEWWHGGITRSVFLYATAPVHLAHVHVVADVAVPGAAADAGPVAPLSSKARRRAGGCRSTSTWVRPAPRSGRLDRPAAAERPRRPFRRRGRGAGPGGGRIRTGLGRGRHP